MNAPDTGVRTELFPAIEPYAAGHLALDGLHEMYWETCGNPQGVPILFLHGGPGAGASPAHRRFFDPAFYRIVIFDQRGAGRSGPLGCVKDNTTQHLISDIERLRVRLEIDHWIVFGGSWGSTLALAYAQTHPQRCLALILRGIFLSRSEEIEWFLYGLRRFFPEAWQQFAALIPEAEREDLLTAYSLRLNHSDPAVHLPAARRWSAYESACSTLLPSPSTIQHLSDDRLALGLARIEAHYFCNRGFLSDNELLANAGKLSAIPGTIVHGRYDMVCPLEAAEALHREWPEANYLVVPDAGHSAWEPGISAQLVATMERLKTSF